MMIIIITQRKTNFLVETNETFDAKGIKLKSKKEQKNTLMKQEYDSKETMMMIMMMR